MNIDIVDEDSVDKHKCPSLLSYHQLTLPIAL